ncbi:MULTISPECIES: AbfB domain-containing protein [Streptomyces]|uniref:Alpha-L-arabinofuranosidase B (ABFB) n=1 Tax=Streptomyces chartreusis NRRL 3882 TaxID=1079985 RepID=A0A2N9BH68_STRCX|nr:MULTISPECIES: AbfB domain-containing protein [Streptomyces]MYS88307.1 alpha-L-arabinofuranosidase [Streptomyces sp. SID5464]SOR82678.1 Alpha-L-arabinofuranosidase B (ABFB) [Streptomyces chartreusis NRRL 3882]
MAENKSRPPQDRPWESGWAPDTTRAPGTRRLWLAGALALATVSACVTAVTVMDNESREATPEAAEPTTLGSSAPGGLISFATPSKSGSGSPGADRGHPSPTPTTSAPTSAAPKPKPQEKAPKAPAPPTSSKHPKPPRSNGTSIRSVNYPDRYWRVRDGSVRLDQIGSGSEQRQDATFQRVAGLADPSCYSFATADGRYLRHRSFVLVKDGNDGSALFRKDATFCPRPASHPGAVMLESVNYPGRFLRHRNFQLRLEPYEHSTLYRADSAFRLVAGLD